MRDTSTSFLKPRDPSRKDILDTMGDQGMDKWRNPVHLPALHDKWPRPENPEAREHEQHGAMERSGPSHRNGSIKR